MRAKLMMWGAAAAVALSSSPAVASVVVVKSLGPSSKAYPPGKTLPESAKITLQGGDVVTVLGPASAQTLRGPGNFARWPDALASAESKRGRFGALRASEVAQESQHLGHRCNSERQDVRDQREQGPAMAAGQRGRGRRSTSALLTASRRRSIGPRARPRQPGRPRCRSKSGAEYQIEWPDTGEKSKRDLRHRARCACRHRGRCAGTDRKRLPAPARPAGRRARASS